jgi:hypothetical protein
MKFIAVATAENKTMMKRRGIIAQLGASLTVAKRIKPKMRNIRRQRETMASARRWPGVADRLLTGTTSFCP